MVTRASVRAADVDLMMRGRPKYYPGVNGEAEVTRLSIEGAKDSADRGAAANPQGMTAFRSAGAEESRIALGRRLFGSTLFAVTCSIDNTEVGIG